MDKLFLRRYGKDKFNGSRQLLSFILFKVFLEHVCVVCVWRACVRACLRARELNHKLYSSEFVYHYQTGAERKKTNNSSMTCVKSAALCSERSLSAFPSLIKKDVKLFASKQRFNMLFPSRNKTKEI